MIQKNVEKERNTVEYVILINYFLTEAISIEIY